MVFGFLHATIAILCDCRCCRRLPLEFHLLVKHEACETVSNSTNLTNCAHSARALCKTHLPLPLDTKLELQDISYSMQSISKYVRFVSLLISFAYQMFAICVCNLNLAPPGRHSPLKCSRIVVESPCLRAHDIRISKKKHSLTHAREIQFGCLCRRLVLLLWPFITPL